MPCRLNVDPYPQQYDGEITQGTHGKDYDFDCECIESQTPTQRSNPANARKNVHTTRIKASLVQRQQGFVPVVLSGSSAW
jgi:hypothetical protein